MNESVYAANLTQGKIFLLSDSLGRYFSFLANCIENKIYAGGKVHDLDPIRYLIDELIVAKDVGLGSFYPCRNNNITNLSRLLE